MYSLVVFLPLGVTLAYYQKFDSPEQANAWRKGKIEYVSFDVMPSADLANMEDIITIPLKQKSA